jgi:hypothetical protein
MTIRSIALTVRRSVLVAMIAFFSLVDGEPSGSPAHVKVLQFAHLVQEKGKRRSVVVVQAETSEKGSLFGVRDVQGNEYVATEPEIVLLGSSHP